MMLLMLVELAALIHKNCNLLLPVVTQHLLMPLIEYRLLLLVVLVLVLMVSIVYCLALIEKLFRPYLLNLMPLLGSLHLLFLLLLLLVLAVLYLPLPRAVLLFVAVLKNHILLLLLLRFWLMVFLHSSYALHKCARFCVLPASSLSLSSACLIFSFVGLSIILSGRSRQKDYPEVSVRQFPF